MFMRRIHLCLQFRQPSFIIITISRAATKFPVGVHGHVITQIGVLMAIHGVWEDDLCAKKKKNSMKNGVPPVQAGDLI
jgi:hypothetical protein